MKMIVPCLIESVDQESFQHRSRQDDWSTVTMEIIMMVDAGLNMQWNCTETALKVEYLAEGTESFIVHLIFLMSLGLSHGTVRPNKPIETNQFKSTSGY